MGILRGLAVAMATGVATWQHPPEPEIMINLSSALLRPAYMTWTGFYQPATQGFLVVVAMDHLFPRNSRTSAVTASSSTRRGGTPSQKL